MNSKNLHQLLRVLFFLTLIVFSLGQLQRWELSPGIAIYMHDILIVVCLMFLVMLKRAELRMKFSQVVPALKKQPLLWLLPAWALAGMTAHWLQTGLSDFAPALYALRLAAYIAFALSSRLIFKRRELKIAWISAGLLILFFGWLQYIFLPDTRFLHIFGWDDHYYRLISTIFDPAFTGMIFVMCFALIHSLRFKLSYGVKWLLLASLSAGILLTYSRSSYLAFAILLVVLMAARWSFKKYFPKAIIITGIMLIILALAPKPGGLGVDLARTVTIEARILNIQSALTELDVQTLIIGKGLFTRTQNPGSHAAVPDNLFVMLITAMGIPGLALSLWGIVLLAKYLYRQDKAVFAILVALILHAQFNNSLLQPFTVLYFLGSLSTIKT